ncbi:hypothetical protein B0H10DRAFT_1969726 [Mycena sp. CBHHK59/15]|nr:hypothetical protein B0H10DRAFT_1969726 [Mycena sp. CBHHK59/15]
MTTIPPATTATNTSDPQGELDALVAKVAALTAKSLELTQLCVDVQALTFIQGTPRTPTQLEAAHPPVSGDHQSWHVVLIGRELGSMQVEEADTQVRGVPNQFHQKKSSCVEALAFYRNKYTDRKVEKWTSAPTASSLAPANVVPAAVQGFQALPLSHTCPSSDRLGVVTAIVTQ